MRLVDQRRVRWQNRAHFFGIAAHLMRRILVDHARSRGAAKRGNDARSSSTRVEMAPFDVDVLALDAALDKLAAIDERQSKLVEMRFFAGLTVDEAAAALDISPITVKRDWAHARAWLFRELGRHHERRRWETGPPLFQRALDQPNGAGGLPFGGLRRRRGDARGGPVTARGPRGR